MLRPSKVHGSWSRQPRRWALREAGSGQAAGSPARPRGREADQPSSALNMADLIETVAAKPGHPILDAADPACPDGKAIARHLGHSWEAVLLDDSAPESPGGRPWDRLPPVVLDTGGIHLSRLPLATRLACDAKSLVAALRVGSDEYPSWTQPPPGARERPCGDRGRLRGRGVVPPKTPAPGT